ncbi:hypothetical protein [Brevibacillus migulae]|uniref:hypothetical protein n=1 Tax=Brevibacillus migulae TaxID=1644114 RepID=UPI00106EC6B9|nr:hypothetical protein [Brevibacillus migulae]
MKKSMRAQSLSNQVLIGSLVLCFVIIMGFVVTSALSQEKKLPVANDSPPITQKTTAASGTLDGYNFPDAQGVQSVQGGGTETDGVEWGGIAWGGLRVGYVGEYKKIKESSIVGISSLPGDEYGVIETNVTVEQRGYNGAVADRKYGKALAFGDLDDAADAGYLFVSYSEAQQWIQVLNGNPSYVFNGQSIKTYTITDLYSGRKYTAYNLAEIAIACGGGGNPPSGDGLTKINSNLYLKRDGFVATPVPTADIQLGSAGGQAMSATAQKQVKSLSAQSMNRTLSSESVSKEERPTAQFSIDAESPPEWVNGSLKDTSNKKNMTPQLNNINKTKGVRIVWQLQKGMQAGVVKKIAWDGIEVILDGSGRATYIPWTDLKVIEAWENYANNTLLVEDVK